MIFPPPETSLPHACQHVLQPHPTTGGAGFTVTASAAFGADRGLVLHYRVRGEATPRLPVPTDGGTADGLWQHTCCEAFVAVPGCAAYREFNFSPSGQWASYAFTDYRQRDPAFVALGAPQLVIDRLADGFALSAELPAKLLPATGSLDLGLTLVLETADGTKSYWALTHAGPQPDFHLRQSFCLALHPDTP
jgi:hypothetical protein